MQTKKILGMCGVLFLALTLVGCSNGDGSVADRAVDQVTGTVTKPLDISKKAKEDIAKATDAENARLNNSLNEDNTMSSNAPKAPVVNQELIKKYPFATIKTSLGDIKVKFSGTVTPLTVTNFLQLAESKFYDNTKFHRVIKGFVIQGGDPLSKDKTKINLWGTGGPEYTVPAEINLKNTRGTIATARQGDQVNPDKRSSGSQFFINAVDNVSLDGGYTVFGEVVSGMDVVDKIENVQTTTADRPIEDVSIISVTPAEK